MLTSVIWVIAASGALAGLFLLAASGFRNGDRPGDALVSAVPGARTVLIRNPSGTPVLVGLSARPALLPAWLAMTHDVYVPRYTRRGKFAPRRYDCVSVVPSGGAAEYTAPIWPRARRIVLTVAIGQGGGRLRVHRLRLGPACFSPQGEAPIMVA